MSTPQLFHNILYPTDFSKPSESIAGHVAGLAKASRARVCLFSVVPHCIDFHGASESLFAPATERGIITLETIRQTLERECKQQLETLRKRYFDPEKSHVSVASGGVAEEIVEQAKELPADLIMMSTRGHGPMRRFLIGSVTAKVLHDAKCAVWTNPHPTELEPFRPYRHVVLAVDYLGWPPELLLRAARIAHLFDAELSLLSAIPPHYGNAAEATGEHRRRLIQAIENRIASLNISARVHVMEGTPGAVVRHVAEEIEHAELIITGRGHLDQSMGHLRTHAYKIIANAPCPVISL
jgi:nucleotide-binding universal stress UspA family protein